jgi:hypothetical protein
MEQPRRKDMYMAVPETGSHNQVLAVNDFRMARDFDGSAGPNGKNVAVVYKDCAIFDWPFRRGGINLCANQGELRGAAEVTCKKYPQQESWSESDSHICNIRSQQRDCSEAFFGGPSSPHAGPG